MQVKWSGFLSAAGVQSWWLFGEVHSVAMWRQPFFFRPPWTLTGVRAAMQIKCSRLNAGKTKRTRSHLKKTPTQKSGIFSPKMRIFLQYCYLVEQQSWFYSVIQHIFLRSEKVFFWALRTKKTKKGFSPHACAQNWNCASSAAAAAPSFLISPNLWFQGLQAISQCTPKSPLWWWFWEDVGRKRS